MRITDNMVTNSLVTQIQQLTSQQSQLQSEVATGLAVSQPSDNPAPHSRKTGKIQGNIPVSGLLRAHPTL